MHQRQDHETPEKQHQDQKKNPARQAAIMGNLPAEFHIDNSSRLRYVPASNREIPLMTTAAPGRFFYYRYYYFYTGPPGVR